MTNRAWPLLVLVCTASWISGCGTKPVRIECADDSVCPVRWSCVDQVCARPTSASLDAAALVDAAGVDAQGSADVAAAAADVSADVAVDAVDAWAPDAPPTPDAPGSCGEAGHCAATERCLANRCVECGADSDCADATKPFCAANGACVSCAMAPALGKTCATLSAQRTQCHASGRCEACLDNTTCAGATPICRAAKTPFECARCERDAECVGKRGGKELAGVCMPDGSCPLEEDVIFVVGGTDCTGRNGSLAQPFCETQKAVDAAVAGPRRIVVVGGPRFATPFTFSGGANRVHVIGREGANILAGSYPGVRVTSGELVLRGLRIHTGGTYGVLAEGTATLRMSRCLIENNTGGILVDGAAYDITNTVIADNKGVNDLSIGGVRTSFAGALLIPAENAAVKRFAFNTVVNNAGLGVNCLGTSVPPAIGLLLYGNPINQSGCSPDSFSSEAEPLFSTKLYRLSDRSPCKDQGPPLPTDPDFDAFDIDGDKRPQGGGLRTDCGADEFVVP